MNNVAMLTGLRRSMLTFSLWGSLLVLVLSIAPRVAMAEPPKDELAAALAGNWEGTMVITHSNGLVPYTQGTQFVFRFRTRPDGTVNGNVLNAVLETWKLGEFRPTDGLFTMDLITRKNARDNVDSRILGKFNHDRTEIKGEFASLVGRGTFEIKKLSSSNDEAQELLGTWNGSFTEAKGAGAAKLTQVEMRLFNARMNRVDVNFGPGVPVREVTVNGWDDASRTLVLGVQLGEVPELELLNDEGNRVLSEESLTMTVMFPAPDRGASGVVTGSRKFGNVKLEMNKQEDRRKKRN